MRNSPIPLALSGLSGALLGFALAALWWGDERSAVSSVTPMALRPSSDADGRPPGAPQAAIPRPSASGSRSGDGGHGFVEADYRAAELNELRARARAAQEQLSRERKRIAELESELEEQSPPSQERTRHEFDLDREDW